MIVENSVQILQSIYSNQNLYRADCRPCQNASVEKQVQKKQPDIVTYVVTPARARRTQNLT